MKNSIDTNRRKKRVYRFKIKKHTESPGVFPKNLSEDEESDINLMMIFGMDKEARNKDPEKYTRLKRQSELEGNKKQKEFIQYSEKHLFESKYSHRCSMLRVKLVLAFILFLISALFEFLAYHTDLILKLVNYELPMLLSMAPLQLLLLGMGLGYRYLFCGMGFKKYKTPTAVVFSLLNMSCLIYYVLVSVFIFNGQLNLLETPVCFYLCPVMLCLVLAISEEMWHLKREWTSFVVVSNDESVKYVLEENKKGSGKRFSTKDGRNSLSVKRSEMVSSFVKNSSCVVKKRGIFSFLVFISFIVSTVLMIYKYVVTNELSMAISSFVMALIFTLPFSGFITYSLAYKLAVDRCYKKGGTIIGLTPFEDHHGVAAVYFDDHSVFTPSGVKLKGFRSYGESRIDVSLSIVREIYKKIDAPPAKMFAASFDGNERHLEVDIIDITHSGIHASVDGRPVYMGDGQYMRELGFTLPDGEERVSPELCLEYLAVSGSVVLKMYIEYAMDEKMKQRIEALRKYGIYMGICTCDPNINDRMMNKRLPISKYPVGILKSQEEKAGSRVMKECESAVVSNNGTGSLLSTLVMCINTSNGVRIDMVVKFFALAAGAIIASLITVFGVEAYVGSWFLMLYQFFWLIPSVITAYLAPRS